MYYSVCSLHGNMIFQWVQIANCEPINRKYMLICLTVFFLSVNGEGEDLPPDHFISLWPKQALLWYTILARLLCVWHRISSVCHFLQAYCNIYMSSIDKTCWKITLSLKQCSLSRPLLRFWLVYWIFLLSDCPTKDTAFYNPSSFGKPLKKNQVGFAEVDSWSNRAGFRRSTTAPRIGSRITLRRETMCPVLS